MAATITVEGKQITIEDVNEQVTNLKIGDRVLHNDKHMWKDPDNFTGPHIITKIENDWIYTDKWGNLAAYQPRSIKKILNIEE